MHPLLPNKRAAARHNIHGCFQSVRLAPTATRRTVEKLQALLRLREENGRFRIWPPLADIPPWTRTASLRCSQWRGAVPGEKSLEPARASHQTDRPPLASFAESGA